MLFKLKLLLLNNGRRRLKRQPHFAFSQGILFLILAGSFSGALLFSSSAYAAVSTHHTGDHTIGANKPANQTTANNVRPVRCVL